jgi:ABC-2 type transport system ATP-binding protein
MEKNHIIEVSHLIKRYKKADKNSVDDVSFYVEKGAFFSLLGPNGAGKTTIISILTSLLSVTNGTVKIAEFDIEKEPHKVRQNIGVIFQNPSLDLNLTAEENIRFHAILYNLYPFSPSYSMMPKQYKHKVIELAKLVGIENDLDKPVKTFSGGMKRKLEIIRSLIHKPKVLFLDEPTTGLDPISRKNLWEYLQAIRKKEDITIFLTTHYLDEAEGCDYISIIDKGKVIAEGSPKEIKDKLIKRYIVLDAENRDQLKSEFAQYNWKTEGTGPFRISIDDATGQEKIKKLKTTLNYLEIHNPTLEDAYVEIITKNNAHD